MEHNNVYTVNFKKPLWMEDKKYEDPTEERVFEADSEYDAKASEYMRLYREKEKLENLMEQLKKDICAKLESEEADVMRDCFGNKLCSYKSQVSNRFDTTLFKKNNPDVYNEYLKQIHSKVFKI